MVWFNWLYPWAINWMTDKTTGLNNWIDRGMDEGLGCINWVVNWCFICLYWFIYLFIRLSMCYCVICWLTYLLTLVWIDWSIDCEFVIEYLNVWWVDGSIVWIYRFLLHIYDLIMIWMIDWVLVRLVCLNTRMVYICVYVCM